MTELYVPAGKEGGVALGEARKASPAEILKAAQPLLTCETCRGTGWVPDEPGGWDVPDMSMSGCPNCTVSSPGGTGINLGVLEFS